jgi:tetratricopeptide (TPR) repeat protein
VRRAHLASVVATLLTLAAVPPPATAQLETFTLAVRELADAATMTGAARSSGIRAAADRMGAALHEWDRTIAAVEARVGREIASASDRRTYQLHVELGVVYRARGRLDDALREFDAAIARRPSAADVQLLRALTLDAADRSEEAARAFLLAWDLDPGSAITAYHAMSRLAASSRDARDRARAVLTDTYRHLAADAARSVAAPFVTLDAIPDHLSRTPSVAGHDTREAFALLRTNHYGEAVAALARLPDAPAEDREDAPSAHLARGASEEAQGRVAEARREYQAALSGALAGRSVLYVAIARLAQVDGDLAGAVDAFAQAVRLDPNEARIHVELAGTYAAAERGDEAFAELVAALLIDPRDAQAHAAIGQLFMDSGRDDEAVAAFVRALQLTPDRYEIRYALATALTRLGRTDDATRHFAAFERARRDTLERRRRDIAQEVERQEAIRRGLARQDDAR